MTGSSNIHKIIWGKRSLASTLRLGGYSFRIFCVLYYIDIDLRGKKKNRALTFLSVN